MLKPSGYDEASAGGGYTPAELGGHYAQIKQVTETQSQSGKDMIVVLLDFVAPDKQAGLFKSQFDSDTRDQRKWPNQGTKYIMVADYADPKATSRTFKGFITSVEKSNNYKVQWGGANWGVQFKGKAVGVVYGEEEDEYNGRVTMRPTIKYFCSTSDVATAQIPKPKYLKNSTNAPGAIGSGAARDNSFINVPDSADEEIPF